MKRIKNLRDMSTKDLEKRLQDIAATQRLLTGKKMAGGGTNPGKWQNIKTMKARILTILNERKLSAERGR